MKFIATGVPARAILISGFTVALLTSNMEDEVVVRVSRFSEKMIEADDRVPRGAPYALYRRTESRAHILPPLSKDFACSHRWPGRETAHANGRGWLLRLFGWSREPRGGRKIAHAEARRLLVEVLQRRGANREPALKAE